MPELPTVAPPSSTGETMGYRPLSILAILGLACAGLFVLIMLLSAGVALWNHTPMLLTTWLLVFPLTGAALAVLALRRIRLSEGTITGEDVAWWCLWLSLLGGLGYCAYYFGTGWAIQSQADRFLRDMGEDSGFFARIQQGQLNSAFLLTQPYRIRGSVNPDDQKKMDMQFDSPTKTSLKGPLTQFAESEIVYLLREAGDNKPEPLGVEDWTYTGLGYVVERIYRVSTPEMELEFTVKVQSTDAEAPGEARRWYVVWPIRELSTSRLTPRGQHLMVLRKLARETFDQWAGKVNSGQQVQQYPKDQTDWPAVKAADPKVREKVREEVQTFLQGKEHGKQRLLGAPVKLLPWKSVAGHIEISHPFALPIAPDTAGKDLLFLAEGHLILRSVDPIDLDNLRGTPRLEVVAYRILQVRMPPKEFKEMKVPVPGGPGPAG